MASPFSHWHQRTGNLNWQTVRWPLPALPQMTENQVTTSRHLCECIFIVWVSSGRRWIKDNNCLVPVKTWQICGVPTCSVELRRRPRSRRRFSGSICSENDFTVTYSFLRKFLGASSLRIAIDVPEVSSGKVPLMGAKVDCRLQSNSR